ncbi:unnamed protein product, partial [Didymodactylos carnosus]
MFHLYNRASDGKINVYKTELFWISDWLDPPHFQARINRDSCIFLGVPLDNNGRIADNELIKLVTSIKQYIGMWYSMNLSLCERSTELQKICNKFLWCSLRPTTNINTLLGKRIDGGLALPQIRMPVLLTHRFYKFLIKLNLRTRVFDVWYRLANYGLITRSLWGKASIDKRC